jgi:TetR/AcrR family transcriptional regulator, tetracycline repressor protein
VALSRRDVLDGAWRLVDEEGLEALTMRRLAHALGVQAGAIYWHFKDKQDLIDALSDAMLSGLLAPALAGRWDAQLAELARRMVVVLTRHRDGARMATLALRPGENALAVTEALLRILRGAGFSRRTGLWAGAALGYYVFGYVTDVQATEAAKARGLEAVLRSFEETINPEQYPQLSEVSDGGIAAVLSGSDFEARFEFGLKVLLDGLEATLRARRAAARARRRRSPKRRR